MSFVQTSLSSWQDFVDFADVATGFLFRGQTDSSWPLKTSFERALVSGVKRNVASEFRERSMLREFKSKYHLYAESAWEPANDFEWLTLLQHHGCPTRLLDFTFSPYVAAYFALRGSAADAAVWALNQYHLRSAVRDVSALDYDAASTGREEINALHIGVVNRCLAEGQQASTRRLLIPLEAPHASQRLARQQGCFVAPSSLGKPYTPDTFVDCLLTSFKTDRTVLKDLPSATAEELLRSNDLLKEFSLIKLIIPQWVHSQATKHLLQMNLNEESLFPGLDGFVRSLAQVHIAR
jgi:hypothetical protein